jgi:hypothetical protein
LPPSLKQEMKARSPEPQHHGLRVIEISVVECLPACVSRTLTIKNEDDKERAKRIGVYARARGQASV